MAMQMQASQPKLPTLKQQQQQQQQPSPAKHHHSSGSTGARAAQSPRATTPAKPKGALTHSNASSTSGSTESQLLKSWMSPVQPGSSAAARPANTRDAQLAVPVSMAPAGKRTLPKDIRLAEAMQQCGAVEQATAGADATAADTLGEDEAAGEATEPYQRYLAEPGRVEYFGAARDVTIVQGDADRGFGLSIVAAQTRGATKRADRALFISSVKPGGAADRCGQIAKHDRLLAVNGIDVTLGDHDQVVGLIRGTGREVTLSLASRRKVKRVRDDRAAELLLAAIAGNETA